LEPNATWATLDDQLTMTTDGNLESDLRQLVAALKQSGHARVVRFDLTDPDIGVPVVKVIVPSLRFNHRLF
jgi:ribosomal protein S12 methylthiotransferase accessory factor YcaO